MNLTAFFVIILIVILFIVCLPLLSGVGNFRLNKNSGVLKSQQDDIKSKRQRLNNALRKADVLKFELNDNSGSDNKSSNVGDTFASKGKFEIDSKTGLKRRIIGRYQKDNNDPNEFDFDLNELIEEDKEQERKEMEVKSNKFKGKEQETYEGLV